jgi:hypothetical protein
MIKNGTNYFHGDGFEFYRDTGLDARNFFHPLWLPSIRTSLAARSAVLS